MTRLAVPFINQLSSPTLDGGSDNNRWFNCVICALLSIILFYHPELTGKISPDEIKDAVYGVAYANEGTDIRRFLPYASQHGVAFTSFSGTNAEIVAAVRKAIQAGTPVIGTELDPYVNTSLPQYAGWLHSFTFFEETDTNLSIMDPFGGKLVTKTDWQWEQDLRTGEVWIGHNSDTMPIPAALKAAGWTDNGVALFAPDKKFKFVLGFRHEVMTSNWHPDDVPLEDEHPQLQLEDSHPELGGGTQQLTRFGGLNWSKKTNQVSRLDAGEEIVTNRKQIAKLYNMLQQAKAELQKASA